MENTKRRRLPFMVITQQVKKHLLFTLELIRFEENLSIDFGYLDHPIGVCCHDGKWCIKYKMSFHKKTFSTFEDVVRAVNNEFESLKNFHNKSNISTQ